MPQMGTYCKAYEIGDLRSFDGWTEHAENAAPNEEGEPRELADDAVVYVQENHVVTDGIFLDEHVLFDDVTPEWTSFCEEQLGFEVPDYEPVNVDAADSA